MFNVEKVTQNCVNWIKEFFEENGKGCNAIVGISGGKDSSVTAALCVRALGKERVIGVLMPCGEQSDISFSRLLVEHLGVTNYTINIKEAVEGVKNSMPKDFELTTQTNLSEDYVGYATRYGDGAGDFSPLANLTVAEVKQIGRYLGLPEELIEKPPIDGLSGKTDEDNLGFTYAVLDKYIREGEIDDENTKNRIDYLHKINLFKLQLIPSFNPGIKKAVD